MNYNSCLYLAFNEKPHDLKQCKHCPHFQTCTMIEHLKMNTTINFYPEFTEIIRYKKCKPLNRGLHFGKVNRARKWEYNARGVLRAKNDEQTLKSLKQSLEHSRKRTIDNIYAYALCNDFSYWVTLTVESAREVGDIFCKKALQTFFKKLRRLDDDVRFIFIVEKHKKGGLHFHGLIGGVNLLPYLVQGIDKKKFKYETDEETGERIYEYDEHGQLIPNPHFLQPMTDKYKLPNGRYKKIPIYNFIDTFYSFGWSTIVEIQPDSPKLQIVNYLSKYMKKETCQLDYNQRAYFKSSNLVYKSKETLYLSSEELSELLNKDLSYEIQEYKDNKQATVFKIYNKEKI